MHEQCQKLTRHWIVLDDVAQAGFEKYINLGGNFVGIHAASDCLRNSTFYGEELGWALALLLSEWTTVNADALAQVPILITIQR